MTSFEFGDVILVRFPFSDQTSSKQRPAAVVSSSAFNGANRDVIIMAITSSLFPSEGTPWRTLLQEWKGAGLIKPSWLKPAVATVEKQIVRRRLGRLNDPDLQRLRGLLDAIFRG